MKAMKRTRLSTLFPNTKNRILSGTTALVLVASSLGSALPLLLPSAASAAIVSTELRLSQNPASSVEAGTGTTTFKAKEVVKALGTWTNYIAVKAPTTLTATVTDGAISTDCSTWSTSATVTIVPGQVVEGSFCYMGGTESAANSVTVTSSIARLFSSTPVSDSLSVSIPVVDHTAPATPTPTFPVSPAYRASADTNHSDWTSVTDVDGVTYNYEASLNSDFSTLAYGPHSTGADTTILNPNEPEGTYYWRVQACDTSMAVNCSAWSDAQTITIDNTLPVVTLSAPTDGTTVHGSHVKVRGSASDANLASCVVNVYSGTDTTATPVATVTCPSSTFATQVVATLDTTNESFPDGSYTVVMTATDLAGNTGSDTRDFTVDNTAPTVSVSPESGLIHGHQSFTICVSDNNPLKHSDNKSVSVYLANANGSHSQNGTVNLSHANGCDTFTVNTNKLKDGSAKLVVGQVRDAEGNTTDSSIFDNYTVDNTDPHIKFTAPGSFEAPFTVGPDVAVHAHDKNGVRDITITVYKVGKHHDKVVKTCTTNEWDGPSENTNSLHCDLSHLHDGTYYVIAQADDNAGNSSSINSGDFIIDCTAPETPVATPGAGTYTFAPSVTLTSSDDLSGLAGIYYTTDGSTPSSEHGTKYTGAFTIASNETLQAIAYDNAGNASDILTAVYVISIPVAPTAPTPPITPAVAPTTPPVFGTAIPDEDTGILAATTGTNSSNGVVKGASTTKPLTVKTKKSGAFLGLGWWWLLVVAAGLGFIWFLLAKRRKDDEDEEE